MTERVAFKIFSIINHTKQWLPRGQMQIPNKRPVEKEGAGLEGFGEGRGRVKKWVAHRTWTTGGDLNCIFNR